MAPGSGIERSERSVVDVTIWVTGLFRITRFLAKVLL
jgi:hypothetical protein